MPLSSATAAWISGTGGDKKIDYINPEIKFISPKIKKLLRPQSDP